VSLTCPPTITWCARQAGASFSLRDRRPTAAAAPALAAVPAVWAVSADDHDEELLDEDALLTEADLKRPALPPSADDCEARVRVSAFCAASSAQRQWLTC
jgi:hypothetical protein